MVTDADLDVIVQKLLGPARTHQWCAAFVPWLLIGRIAAQSMRCHAG